MELTPALSLLALGALLGAMATVFVFWAVSALQRAFQGRAAPRGPPPLSLGGTGTAVIVGDGKFRFPVVGTSYHQRALEKIAGGRTEETAHHFCAVLLVPQPDNAYDSGAVAVDIGSVEVGHLSRLISREFLAALQAAGYASAACEAEIVGGWDRGDGDAGSFGLRLNACRPFRLESASQWQAAHNRRR